MEIGTRKLVQIGKVVLLEYVLTAGLLLLEAALLYKAGFSEKTADFMIKGIYVVVNLLGGFLIGKLTETRKFIWGAFVGVGYFAIISLVSFAVHRSLYTEFQDTIIRFLFCLIPAAFGGMIS